MALQQHELQALILAIHAMDADQKAAVFDLAMGAHEYDDDKGYLLGVIASKHSIALS